MREGQQHRDLAKFKANYDAIDFSDAKPHAPSPSGRYVMRDGELTPVEDVGFDGIRQRDATDIRSLAAGVAVHQVEAANKKYGHLGVKFDPGNGDAVFKDRQSKLKVLKAMKMVDHNETRGGSSRSDQQTKDVNLFMADIEKQMRG